MVLWVGRELNPQRLEGSCFTDTRSQPVSASDPGEDELDAKRHGGSRVTRTPCPFGHAPGSGRARASRDSASSERREEDSTRTGRSPRCGRSPVRATERRSREVNPRHLVGVHTVFETGPVPLTGFPSSHGAAGVGGVEPSDGCTFRMGQDGRIRTCALWLPEPALLPD